MTDKQSDTPRTDEWAERSLAESFNGPYTSESRAVHCNNGWDFARTLERELNQVRVELAVAQSKLKHYERATPEAFRDVVDKLARAEERIRTIESAGRGDGKVLGD
jgi:flagellar hook-basal body complex protein FliE